MARFLTKIRKARFVVSPFSAQQMMGLGQSLADDVRSRIQRGENVYDGPATPLKPSYLKYKTRRGRAGIRDWFLTGRTLRSMKVLTATENRAVIGFTDAITARRAAMNNRRERQFGMSPRNRQNILRAIHQARYVRVAKVA